MTRDREDGNQPYESGGGAYEFPPLEKQGKSAQYRAASEFGPPFRPRTENRFAPVPQPTNQSGSVPPPGYGHGPVPPSGYPVPPQGFRSISAPPGYPSTPTGPTRFRSAPPNRPHRWPPAFGEPGRGPGVKGGSAAPFAVVGLLAAFVFAVLVAWGDHSSDSGASATSRAMPTPSAAPATTGRNTTTAPATTTQSSAVIAAVLPGYQGVAVDSRGIAYDVPVGWTVDSPSVIRGFEGETGRISGTGTAVDGEDYCGENTRTLAFVSRAQETDHAATATEFGASTAEIAYDSSGWTRRVTGPEPLTTRSGITGWMVETSGNQTPDPAECATEYSVYTFVFPGTETPGLILTLAADRGVPGEVSPEQAREIFGTVRLLS
ncbi:hypothetical protein [Nocardia shimofusensis]|uniref:hypothetical protein n=1 Tax=Nocardia shimofusensis TaxID=228596 RepID=UPI000B1B93E1|nr:hypothetical protein [Nocardia shimofusensis]